MRKIVQCAGLTSLVCAGLMLPAIHSAQATSGTVTVAIEGLRNRKGRVCLSVFNSSRGFPSNGGNALKSQCVNVTDGNLKVSFSGLKAGSYAVAILHDENADGEANRNGLGIPTEGFGFSRNPALRAGPPKFADAAFMAAGSKTEIQVKMTYLF